MMFDRLYRQAGSRTFLQLQQKKYSYQWLHDKIKKITGLYESKGIRAGDRILLALSDESEFAAIFLASLANGITTILMDPATKSGRITGIINRTNPRLVIADESSLLAWNVTGTGGTEVLSFKKDSTVAAGLLGKFLKKEKPAAGKNDYFSALQGSPAASAFPSAPQNEDIAYIIFTSGTTAASKGVAVSFGNLEAHLVTLSKVYGLSQDSVLLNQLLLWHADGSIQGPVLAAFAGCSWHSPFTFSIDKIPALLDYGYAHDVTHWFAVPAMLNMLVTFSEGYEDSFQYPAFKALISVSAHLEAPLWDKIESTFKVAVNNVYGLTETVAGSLFCGPLPGTYRKYTAGKPIDTECIIAGEDGHSVADNNTGELWLRGKHIMKRYYGDEETTAASFRNGWLLTGDLASRDADGFITIKGRKKNLIISGGYNIQPEEITECLLMHQAVSEACAIGIADEVFGEKLVAAVVLKAHAETGALDLADHCRALLEDKKVPQKIYILPALPKGASGKIQLNELRSMLHKPAPEATVAEDDIASNVITVASEAFQLPASSLSVSDTSHTINGWDSLAHLTFVTLLEERFSVRFSTAEVMTLNSIRKAIQLIKERHV